MTEDDASLLAAVQRGDEHAWNALVDRYGQVVWASARAAGADRSLATDVAQMTWMRVLTNIDSIREPSKIKGWLAIVARNTARDELRKSNRSTPVESFDDKPAPASWSPEDFALSNETSSEIGDALRKISTKCQELLTLLFAADLSYQEIAEMMSVPIGSIGPTRQRCLDSLERHIADASDPWRDPSPKGST